VLAVPGDVVDLQPRRVSVNHRPVPDSATAARDSRDRALAHVQWGRHVVVTGKMWLLRTYD
jgi:type IV secretory pathway protease TraF